MPKVLLLITKGEIGGAQTHVLTLCQALANQFKFIAVIGGSEPTTWLGNALEDMGVPVFRIAPLRNALSPLQVLAAVGQLLDILRRHRPDIVHAHSSMAGVIARIAHLFSSVPVIYTVHGFGFKPEVPLFQRWIAWLAEFALARLTSHMICVSVHEHGLAQSLPVRNARISVIPNALIDTNYRANPGVDPARIIMVARLAPPKRVDLFLRALALLRDQHGYEVPASVVGKGPQLQSCQNLARELGLQSVDFPGEILDVPERLAQHAIFVLVSDHEGLPISIIEAMRAGLSIVASDLPGIRELITYEKHGLLARNEVEELADAIHALIVSAPLRVRLGGAARQRYEDCFSVKAVAQPVAALYAKLIAHRTS